MKNGFAAHLKFSCNWASRVFSVALQWKPSLGQAMLTLLSLSWPCQRTYPPSSTLLSSRKTRDRNRSLESTGDRAAVPGYWDVESCHLSCWSHMNSTGTGWGWRQACPPSPSWGHLHLPSLTALPVFPCIPTPTLSAPELPHRP